MTFAASLVWSLGRAIAISCLIWPCCRQVAEWGQNSRAVRSGWRRGLILAPFLFPELLVGYAYGPLVAGLPAWAEATCAGLMALRLVPVGVVALWLTPPTDVTRSALYLRRLMLRSPGNYWAWVRLWIRGPVREVLPAWLLMLLVAFQQFELPALLTATSWTDWLFVQQVTGLPLIASLQASIIPCLLQVAILLLAGIALRRNQPVDRMQYPAPATPYSSWLVWTWLVASWLGLIVYPASELLAGVPAGLAQLLSQPLRQTGLLREMIAGLSVATLAAWGAWSLCSWSEPRSGKSCRTQNGIWQRGVQPLVVALLLIPGLLGSLLLSLMIVAVFQWPGFSSVYGTPLLWWLGLTFVLCPRAWLLRMWLNTQETSAMQLGNFLRTSPVASQRRAGHRLWERLVWQPRWFAGVILVYWGYLDLTTAYLLAPVGMSSGIVRLYNFMHFGRTVALSAEAAVLLIGPLLIAGVLGLMWRSWRG